MHGGDEKSKSLKGTDHLGNLVVDGRIVFN